LARARAEEEDARSRTLEQERIAEMEKDRFRAEKRAERLADVGKRLEKELREERAVSEGLMRNLERMKERCVEAEKEKGEISERVRELEEQVRDVMVFLEARDRIEKEAGEGGAIGEAMGGSVELRAGPQASDGGTSKKKKGKKR